MLAAIFLNKSRGPIKCPVGTSAHPTALLLNKHPRHLIAHYGTGIPIYDNQQAGYRMMIMMMMMMFGRVGRDVQSFSCADLALSNLSKLN